MAFKLLVLVDILLKKKEIPKEFVFTRIWQILENLLFEI